MTESWKIAGWFLGIYLGFGEERFGVG